MRIPTNVLICGALFAAAVSADEGMWTFDHPPIKMIEEKYHFTLTQPWLDHIRLASARLNDGGSGSFVSPHGLLLTNHHVARGQLQKNSTSEHDYIKNGFYATTPDQEIKSPDLEVNILISSEDVTGRIQAAVKGAKNADDEFSLRRKTIAEIEKESQEKTGLRSDVVTLYQGGEYWLYRYKKYTDVRIVFAPEEQAAFFGGDPDNFTYPRYDLDMALFRVYENGKPIDTPDYLKWNPKGAADDELVFVSGNPGTTERLDTLAELENERDADLPNLLKMLRGRLDVMKELSTSSPEHSRQSTTEILELENSVKAIDGEYQGLNDKHVMDTKRADEQKFKTAVLANPQWKAAYGSAWDEIAAAEIKKPDGERLPGYHDAQLDSLRFELFSPAPVYRDMELAQVTGALELDLQEVGPSDPFIQILLGGKSPREAATALVNGTHLDDPAVRKQLIEGGQAAVEASTDPEIVLARKLEPMRREFVKWMEDNVQSVAQRAGEALGKARFAVYGRSAYPDATFTLRLSYGQVMGYPMNGTKAPSKTTFYGLYDRASSFDFQGPFWLSSRYLEGRSKLDLSTPFNFVTTNDIIGGNSGSPVINRAGEIVGLVFDGNIESLVGNYIYDIQTNRTVAVHTAAMTEALRKLYGAQKLLDEMLGN